MSAFAAPPSHMDFSLVLGGPLYQLMRRTRLANDAFGLLRTRLIVIVAIAWVPLLVLSLLEGQALGGPAAVPFLKDVEAQVRFLVALPFLVVAELVVHQRMRLVVRQFLDRQLIPESALLSGTLTITVKGQSVVRTGTLAYTFANRDGAWKIEAQAWGRTS